VGLVGRRRRNALSYTPGGTQAAEAEVTTCRITHVRDPVEVPVYVVVTRGVVEQLQPAQHVVDQEMRTSVVDGGGVDQQL